MAHSSGLLSTVMTQISRVAECQVSIEDLTGITLRHSALRIHPEQHWHQGGFCRYIKLRDANRSCAVNKQKSKNLAIHLRRPFEGCCPFGIWDMAWPVIFRGEVVAVLYLGYFQGKEPFGKAVGAEFAGPIPPAISDQIRKRLYHFAELLTGMICLCLENDLLSPRQPMSEPKSIADMARQFIAANFREPISLGDFASLLRMHPNYVGQILKAKSGSTFRQMLRDYRIQQAQLMLANPAQSDITAVAMTCGFQDSNYFSSTFRASTGTSPRAWQKKRQLEKAAPVTGG